MQPPSRRARPYLHLVVAVTAGAALVLALLPAFAAPLPGRDTYPKVAFVSRNDVPFDSLAVGPVAGAMGGIIVITPPAFLSDAARQALVDFAPQLVIIAGGPNAVSPETEQQIREAGAWVVDRAQGEGRDETAADVARILAEQGVGRPIVTGSKQVVGDAYLGGHLAVDTLHVEQDGADGGGGPIVAGVVDANGDVLSGTGFSVDKDATGTYTIDIAAIEDYDYRNYVALVTPGTDHLTAFASSVEVPDGRLRVILYDTDPDNNGVTKDGTFQFAVWMPSS